MIWDLVNNPCFSLVPSCQHGCLAFALAFIIIDLCGDVNKLSPQTHILEDLAPSWGRYLGRLWKFKELHLGGSTSPGWALNIYGLTPVQLTRPHSACG